MKPETHIDTVSPRHWGPDDDYAVVETQVFDIPVRTPVRVTITPITQEEYTSYLEGKTDVNGNKKEANSKQNSPKWTTS